MIVLLFLVCSIEFIEFILYMINNTKIKNIKQKMFIEKKVTKKIAFLARIGLTEKEEEQFSKDLSNILKWMEELKKIDVKDIEPLRNVNETQLIERDDAKVLKI